jgi:hypothetical protein
MSEIRAKILACIANQNDNQWFDIKIEPWQIIDVTLESIKFNTREKIIGYEDAEIYIRNDDIIYKG